MKAVKFCAILQREHTSKEVFKKGKKEAGTLGRLRVCTLEGQEVFSCYTMENAGIPTDESNKDKPIVARTYSLHWADSSVCVPASYKNKGANGRHKAIWLHDPSNPNFAKRRIMIHIGNDAIDSLGCILLGKGYNAQAGSITNSTVAVEEFYNLCAQHGIEHFSLEVRDAK
ncbi:DUF5675 family protein [Helicobacter salomonis]|uniref:DUF5675 family protein n=1 Tax=Helicobacter salomonis TaxID=56878 RepID=UPI000CF12A04|nr:DUF5675 family protein [Helicobacter salomonis]